MIENATERGAPPRILWIILCLLSVCAVVPAAHAQQKKGMGKVPVIGRLDTSSNHLAFSGRVASVDLKERILNVNALQGRDTEIFPLRKSTRIEGIDGKKLKLKALVPGTSILIYYEQKKGEREIKNIVVLEGVKNHGTVAAAPTS